MQSLSNCHRSALVTQLVVPLRGVRSWQAFLIPSHRWWSSANNNPRNPSIRRKRELMDKIKTANYNVYEHQLPQELKNRELFKDDKEILNLVEQRILQSVQNGEFTNLKNKGKPLPEYPSSGDPAEDLAMRILKQNNVKPPWLELLNNIDETKRQMRKQLRAKYLELMSVTGSPRREFSWHHEVRQYETQVTEVNKMIDHFNLIRPPQLDHIHRFRLKMDKELDRCKSDTTAGKNST